MFNTKDYTFQLFKYAAASEHTLNAILAVNLEGASSMAY